MDNLCSEKSEALAGYVGRLMKSLRAPLIPEGKSAPLSPEHLQDAGLGADDIRNALNLNEQHRHTLVTQMGKVRKSILEAEAGGKQALMQALNRQREALQDAYRKALFTQTIFELIDVNIERPLLHLHALAR